MICRHGAVKLLGESRERLGGRLRAGPVSLRRALPVRVATTFRHISLPFVCHSRACRVSLGRRLRTASARDEKLSIKCQKVPISATAESPRKNSKPNLPSLLRRVLPTVFDRGEKKCPKLWVCTWASERKFHRAVESFPRRALDHSIGRMARRAPCGADGVAS
jgi:hypothetical protein